MKMLGMVKDYPPLSDFTLAFAREYKAFMVANDIKGYQIAEKLGRNESYVSVRVNGKRALDTQDVDVLAILAGWSGNDLMLELARRAKDALSMSDAPEIVDLADRRRTRVEGSVVDERAVASEFDGDYDEDDGYDA